MIAFPSRPTGSLPEPEHPHLQQEPRSAAEARARWEVRAAQWRAVELAERVFGHVSDAALIGLRARGSIRGLLRMDVPFGGLEAHHEREARFLAAVAADPVLARVPLVYVFGPRPD
ncbi:MAG TPA: hypothetical protein VFQ22_08060 [Longimicrobiales bacterium]|nr:hypothetical protein [Longimicrobiales bacterium]